MHANDPHIIQLIEGTITTALDFWLHSLAEAHASGDKELEERICQSLKLFVPKLNALYTIAGVPL